MNSRTYLQGGSGSEEPVPGSNPMNPGHNGEDSGVSPYDDDHIPLDPDDEAPVEEELSR